MGRNHFGAVVAGDIDDGLMANWVFFGSRALCEIVNNVRDRRGVPRYSPECVYYGYT